MRDRWELVRLGDNCKVVKIRHNGDALPFVGMEHIGSGTGTLLSEPTPIAVKSATFRFNPGQILYGRLRPYLNKVFIPEFAGHCSTEIFPIECLDTIDNRFLFYWLTSDAVVERINRTSTGTRMPRANVNEILNFEIRLPSRDEQQRIVAILDEAFAGIASAVANTEKNLTNARELFESHLNTVFTQKSTDWIKLPLQELTSKIGSGATPRGGKNAYKLEGISLIRSMNVHDMGFRYKNLAFIDDEQAGKLSNVVIQDNDVLLNITGASVARCCVVAADILPARVNQHVAIIRPISDKLDASFLRYALISRDHKDELLRVGEEGGSTRQAITKSQIQKFVLSFPEALVEQHKIVEVLDDLTTRVDTLESIYRQKLDALTELKQSILQKAFAGELTAAPDKALAEAGA